MLTTEADRLLISSEEPLAQAFFSPPIQPGGAQPQGPFWGPEEVEQGQQAPHGVAEHRPPGRPGDAHVQRLDKDVVHHNVGGPGGQGEEQPRFGQLGGDKEDLKGHLEHEHRAPAQQDPAVGHAVVHEQVAGPGQPGDGLNEQRAAYREGRAQCQHHQDDHGKIPVGQLGLALTHGAGHHGAAAGAQHKAGGGQDHGHRKDNIHRRQGVLPHQIGDKQAVHHAVHRGEDHHNNRWQGEAEQGTVGKMVRKLDVHRKLFLLGCV